MRRLFVIVVVLVALVALPTGYYVVGSARAVDRAHELQERQLALIGSLGIPGLERLPDLDETTDSEVRRDWIVHHSSLNALDGLFIQTSYAYLQPGQKFYEAEGTTEEVCRRIAAAVSLPPERTCAPTDSEEGRCLELMRRLGDLAPCQPSYSVPLPPGHGFEPGTADINRGLTDGETLPPGSSNVIGQAPRGRITVVEIHYPAV